jgi:hypothetical protein
MANPGPAWPEIQKIHDRGEPYWWLYAARCQRCGAAWLVAQEERQNDVILLHRLSAAELDGILTKNEWPSTFDQYETLLRLGRAAGHSVLWPDPLGDSSLESTIADLARQRPGITVEELAELLELDTNTTAVLAERARLRHGVTIRSDGAW